MLPEPCLPRSVAFFASPLFSFIPSSPSGFVYAADIGRAPLPDAECQLRLLLNGVCIIVLRYVVIEVTNKHVEM